MDKEGFIPNARLRRARSLRGWSQADLAAEVGTSFEMVSRWERGVTIPSPYFRERLCAALVQTAEELGLIGGDNGSITPPSSPFVLLAASHLDAEKPIVSQIKAILQDRGIMLWSSRQIGRQGSENSRTALRRAVQSALFIMVIVSPEARNSRHVREALEMASIYQLPVYGVWIEGERWQDYLPADSIELVAPIDARTSNAPFLIKEISTALARVGLTSSATITTTPAAPTAPPAPLPADVPLLPWPARPHRLTSIADLPAALFIGLIALVIAGGALGSVSLLAHFGAFSAHGSSPALIPVRGGTWTEDILQDPFSFIPNGNGEGNPSLIDQALYLPLFYGDAYGLVHAGAATEVPTVQNGGISADGKTWTFHVRPHLVWSDGQPYDARDVDYTWKLWLNPAFNASNTNGLELIRSAVVSADQLSITFHLKQAYAPFLQLWIDGFMAPLPAHHFNSMTPQAIQQSTDNLDPTVTSGPFLMAESVSGSHYTLVRNPRYYLASKGLPYLDRVVFRVADAETAIRDLQAGSITSTWSLDLSMLQTYRRLANYSLVTAPTSATFEAIFFNFHNTILASHLEVRQAMAMAIDQQSLIKVARQGYASKLCTDHPSAIHPGYQPGSPQLCPQFDLVAANKLLDDNGWVKGTDGVRTRNGQRLEFELSTTTNVDWRSESEAIIQRDFMAVGIKLDIQNYNIHTFFGSFLPAGKASPPSGALAGRFDIAEYGNSLNYDPDDSYLMACDQIPPNGANFTFLCNPALDALYKQELVTVEPGQRQRIFLSIHEIFLTQLPFIVLYSPTDLAIVRKGMHNYQPSPIEGSTINIWQWWCDRGRC